tara:strand:- start:1333 stop:1476 length:144 start_codon:yes stop_codon:yes gene_type:complete
MTLHECKNCLEMVEEEDFEYDEKVCKSCRPEFVEASNWNLDYKDDAD